MKLKLRKFQEGGAMPPQEVTEEAPVEETAPATQETPENPLVMIAQMAVQALQNQDCQMAMQVCEAFIQIAQQAQGGGAPAEAPQGEPVYRKGGILKKRI